MVKKANSRVDTIRRSTTETNVYVEPSSIFCFDQIRNSKRTKKRQNIQKFYLKVNENKI